MINSDIKCNNNNLIRLQKKLLDKGRIEKLGFFESITVKLYGKLDGKRGIPSKTSDGKWESPLMRKELAAYEEFCNKLWGKTQIELKDDYSELGFLLFRIKYYEQELELLRVEKPKPASEQELNIRFDGEENLSIDQVRRRRGENFRNQIASHNAKIHTLNSKIDESYESIERLHNYIFEINNVIKLICERVKKHLEQRRNIYWDSAYKIHPYREIMPVYPETIHDFKAENANIAQHKELEEEVIKIINIKKHLSIFNDELY